MRLWARCVIVNIIQIIRKGTPTRFSRTTVAPTTKGGQWRKFDIITDEFYHLIARADYSYVTGINNVGRANFIICDANDEEFYHLNPNVANFNVDDSDDHVIYN